MRVKYDWGCWCGYNIMNIINKNNKLYKRGYMSQEIKENILNNLRVSILEATAKIEQSYLLGLDKTRKYENAIMYRDSLRKAIRYVINS
jgi:hypothetical protein